MAGARDAKGECMSSKISRQQSYGPVLLSFTSSGRGWLAHCRVTILRVFFFAAVASCSSEIKYDTLDTLQSENVSVVIEAASKPQDDGSVAVRVRRIDARGDIVVYDGSVANGGEPLTLDNIRPDLRSPSDLRLCLNGAGQADLSVRMNVLVRFIASNERICTR